MTNPIMNDFETSTYANAVVKLADNIRQDYDQDETIIAAAIIVAAHIQNEPERIKQ